MKLIGFAALAFLALPAGSAGAVDVAATPLDTSDDVAPFRGSIRCE